MASSASRAGCWIAAASVGAVEALKDQTGLCRWNYVLRSVYQQAKSNIQANNNNSTRMASAAAAAANSVDKLRKERITAQQKAKESEESLRTVMYLSCWGPN